MVADGLRIRNITLDDDGNYTCRAEVESEGRYSEQKILVAVHSKRAFNMQANRILMLIEVYILCTVYILDNI